MAKYSHKISGKEVGAAEVYAPPHDMKGKAMTTQDMKRAVSTGEDPNRMCSQDVRPETPAMRVSVGNPDRDDVKTDGIKIRGTGAATKGTMARGPMA